MDQETEKVMSLLALVRRAPKRISAAVLMVAAAIIIPTAALAWGPDRQTFTIENPSDHVQFNSITNNPNIGDERNFVGIRETTAANVWYDTMNVQKGKEYYVRMYVHNNAASSLNLKAKDVTAKFNLPTTTGTSIQVNGFLSASNVGANKNGNNGAYAEVYDHATFTGSENFNLAYVAGSLKYENNAFGPNGTTLPESIFTSAGAKLGYDSLNGEIPGCFQYAGYVTFKVKPQFATPTTDFTVQKEVRKDGEKTFVESVATKPGDKLNYRIVYTNTGTAQVNNVILKDTLPSGVSFVPGTVKILNANNPGGALIQDGDKLFTSGVNIGHYTGGSNAIVVFNAIVDKNVVLPVCGTNTLRNTASAQPEGQNPKQDTADVTANKECQPGKISVCELSTKKIVTINESEFDASKYSKDLGKCVELPQTGTTENIVAIVGLGALIASIAYYVASRRALNQ